MPAGSDCTVLPCGVLPGDAATESVCVYSGQFDMTTSVSDSVAQCPLSPLSVLSNSSSDVYLVAVEITPAKPRPCPVNDLDRGIQNAGSVSVKQETRTMEGTARGSEEHFSDDCYVVDNPLVVTSSNSSPEIVIIESDFFVDTRPIQQISGTVMDMSGTFPSSLSNCDVNIQVCSETDTLSSICHPIPIRLNVAPHTSETATATVVTPAGTHSKHSSPNKTTKRTQLVGPESDVQSEVNVVSSQEGQSTDSETRWVKVGDNTAVIESTTQNIDVVSSGTVSTEVTIGGASKRRIIEVKPISDEDGKEPPPKKACFGKRLAMDSFLRKAIRPCGCTVLAMDREGFMMSTNQGRNVALVPTTQGPLASSENADLVMVSSSPGRATRRLQKKRLFKLPQSKSPSASTANFKKTDLRSVIVNLRNEKVIKTTGRSPRANEGDLRKTPGVGKNRVASKRGRSESESSSRGGSVDERSGARDDRSGAREERSSAKEDRSCAKDDKIGAKNDRSGARDERGGARDDNARPRLQTWSTRWDKSSSKYSNDSRYSSRGERSSSTRRGQDVRSRLPAVEADKGRGRGGSLKVCKRLCLTVQWATVTLPAVAITWPAAPILDPTINSVR